MALKDWKKIAEKKDLIIWYNKKKSFGLVYKDYTFPKGIPSDIIFPYVIIVEKLKKGSLEIEENIVWENFRTKHQAIVYAKKYMRRVSFMIFRRG